MPQISAYQGRKVALLTQHGKEQVIAPALEPHLGCVVEHVTGFDTDQLGTFTRDVSRPGTQLEAARRKARKGIVLSGLSVGMASEGSFGPDPFSGMFPWNVELLIWIDDQMGLEVVGIAQGTARSGHLQTSDWGAIETFAVSEGFPQHQLVLRPNGQDDLRIYKGVADWARLKSCFLDCIAESSNRQVFVETDLRAFANPSRMQNIEQAARDLLQRLQSCCPACKTPGYWVTERQTGLPCAACGLPTSSYRNAVWTCLRCPHRSVQPRTDCDAADPKHCASCNP
ncbi:MAG: hypothetical protein HHJ16_15630 [Polaromonas sp.]|uniref:DUF6671 family protein n=1 Tax=Polaromonas sp. TaxID=1869339 RepID=UPI001856BB58|nr:DUF6671 family protein [Polaromonas sp.]NMM11686.1 hypothetical protein [Polaromonas sp.]